MTTHQQSQSLSWHQVLTIATSYSPSDSTQAAGDKRLQLKEIDTVFFDHSQKNDEEDDGKRINSELPPSSNGRYVVKDWTFTSRKGEVTKQKSLSALTLQYIFDRFGRFSLANPANATGPRIVALGYCYATTKGDGKKKECVHFTVA